MKVRTYQTVVHYTAAAVLLLVSFLFFALVVFAKEANADSFHTTPFNLGYASTTVAGLSQGDGWVMAGWFYIPSSVLGDVYWRSNLISTGNNRLYFSTQGGTRYFGYGVQRVSGYGGALFNTYDFLTNGKVDKWVHLALRVVRTSATTGYASLFVDGSFVAQNGGVGDLGTDTGGWFAVFRGGAGVWANVYNNGIGGVYGVTYHQGNVSTSTVEAIYNCFPNEPQDANLFLAYKLDGATLAGAQSYYPTLENFGMTASTTAPAVADCYIPPPDDEPTATTTAAVQGMNTQEQLFVASVFLFILSLMAWRIVFAPVSIERMT